jgi:two-component system, chemotaxis family, chemotaxis protein CheV
MATNPERLPEILKAGSNEHELIIIKMYNRLPDGVIEKYSYGVNVAKVREIIPMPTLTKVPDMPDYAEALVEVRGQVVPVINLAKWLKFQQAPEMQVKPKIIILEMLGACVGMIVHDVERIRRIKWDQIKAPPALMQARHGGRITGVTKLDDTEDTLLLILDLENVIAEMGAFTSLSEMSIANIDKALKEKLSGTVLIIDDSVVARRILKEALEKVGIVVIESVNGKEALSLLNDFLGKLGDKPITEIIQVVISDLEMPEMDGLTFVKRVKEHPGLKTLPVIINTSLSGPEGRDKAKMVGADGYIVKNEPAHLFEELEKFLKH